MFQAGTLLLSYLPKLEATGGIGFIRGNHPSLKLVAPVGIEPTPVGLKDRSIAILPRRNKLVLNVGLEPTTCAV